jgi:hypothetical protein
MFCRMTIYRDKKPASLRTRKQVLYSGFACVLIAGLSTSAPAFPDTPIGWINNNNPSAYTTTRGQFEISGSFLAVNDTLDFLDLREELLVGQDNLVGDSGDLTGQRLDLNYGIFSTLSVFYTRQQHEFALDFGDISSVKLLDIDESLDTEIQSAGLKWTFYQANLLNPDNRLSAASLEFSAFSSKTRDFGITVSEVYLPNLTILFRDPTTFSVVDMEDEGWKARLLYTLPLTGAATVTAWTGYGESKASSATTSNIDSQTIARFFAQSFEIEETYLYLGASVTFEVTPRLPLLLSYEYISISNSQFTRNPLIPPAGLPGFIAQTSQGDVDNNHSLFARISYWLTPDFNISLSGNLFSNQFIGVVPHYNNPLSGTFSDKPYGFAGLQMAYRF